MSSKHDDQTPDRHKTQFLGRPAAELVSRSQRGNRTGCLTVIRGRGNDLGKHLKLEESTVIGRGRDCDLVIEDFGASRRHCRLERETGERYSVEDLGSTNGTRVDGDLLRDRRQLQDGEKLYIGEAVLRFRLYDEMDLGFSSQVAHLLGTDPLTGLQSKRTFDDALDYAVTAAARAGESLSLMMMDLDGIKQINDTHGHLFGAFSIQQAGRLLERVLANRGRASRFGGDEFTVFLPDCEKAPALAVAEQIRVELEQARLEKDGVSLKPTISIGVASLPEDGSEVLQLVAAADRALYEAKAAGKNRVCAAG